jgi:hypothetical protein
MVGEVDRVREVQGIKRDVVGRQGQGCALQVMFEIQGCRC